MAMTLGFKVLQRKRAISAEWIEKYKTIPVANISDSINRMTGFGPRLRPYHAGSALCGTALTVKSRPGDNLMLIAAVTMIKPGDVIVADCGGDLTNSIAGERMLVAAQRRGAAGFIVNGAIRDVAWVKKNDFPVYAAGVHHRGPYKSGPGEINVPVAIDGQVIEPGDLIIGDEDGLLCVPYDEVEALYPIAHAKQLEEAATFDDLARGDQNADRERMFARIRKLGCYVEE